MQLKELDALISQYEARKESLLDKCSKGSYNGDTADKMVDITELTKEVNELTSTIRSLQEQKNKKLLLG